MTTMYSHWVRDNWSGSSFAFEAKIVKHPKKSLAFSSFQDHQLPNLYKVSTSGIYWKIPDLGSLNPFDGFYLKGLAYVVIFWYEARKKKLFTMIDIDKFMKFMGGCGKKSIRECEAVDIAEYVDNLR